MRYWQFVVRQAGTNPITLTVGTVVVSLGVGATLMMLTATLPRQERLEASNRRAARIPRLEARQREIDAETERRTEALRAMIQETRTKTFGNKLKDAASALYSFHTGRPDGH